MQNLHTHTRFSDGSDAPEKYIEAALAHGLTALGFSDHSPLPFENSFALKEEEVQKYCEEVQNSKLEIGNWKLEIFLGMEADFIPGMGHPFAYFRENFPIDYLIGSVHLVRNGKSEDLWFIDGPDPATYDDGLNLLFGGDIRRGVTAYYRQINEMLSTSKMEIIGHLDKIKMHNRGRLFSEGEGWYSDLVNETLDLVKQTGVIVEVNTRGIYKKRSDTHFPGPELLKKIHELKIPVIISSDAHKPAEVAMLFDETADLLYQVGFREVMELTASGWEMAALRG
jgi:histidinol-phosphatase (PHP family)